MSTVKSKNEVQPLSPPVRDLLVRSLVAAEGGNALAGQQRRSSAGRRLGRDLHVLRHGEDRSSWGAWRTA